MIPETERSSASAMRLDTPLQKSKIGEIDEATALKNLNIVYDYLKANPSYMHVRYREIYTEISEEKRRVYYISRLGYTEVEYIKALAMKENG